MRGSARYIYVIDSEGNIRVSRNIGTLHHADLVNGENIYGAGELGINENGVITYIDDFSGHYNPSGTKFFPYMQNILQKIGLTTSSDAFVAFGP